MADKTKKRNDGSVDLTKAYRTAAEKLITSLRGGDAQGIKVRFTKTLQAVKIELDTLNAREVEQAITEGAEQSLIKFNKTLLKIFNGRAFTLKDLTATGLNIQNQKAAEAVLERRAADVKKSAVYRENFLELRGQLAGVCNALQAEVNSTLHKLAGKDANTVSAAIDELRERLKESGCLNVKYSNGASVGVDGYANMVCRSARTESANVENLKAAQTFGTDLVECVGNAVTCEVCAQFRDRVFSVSGKDKRYPPLRGSVNSPLRDGYDLIHPNCRCEFRAYFEALHTPEENEAKRKFSNRPFEGDKRTDAQRRAYQEWQVLNRQIKNENIEYAEMKKLFGDNMPYDSLAGFRRAKRANSQNYLQNKARFIVEKRQKRILAWLQNNNSCDIIKLNSVNGIEIRETTEHLSQRLAERNIAYEDIAETLSKPLKVDNVKYDTKNRPSIKIIGERCTVYVNPENKKIITIHRTHSKTVNKLKGDEKDVYPN